MSDAQKPLPTKVNSRKVPVAFINKTLNYVKNLPATHKLQNTIELGQNAFC